jgi:adenylate cyclase
VTQEQRRLAAILVADVVGYSKLVGRDEAGTLAKLAALKRELIEPAIAKHSGRLFKAVGDGFLVEFASAVQAVACAVAIQRADPSLPLRIGIHLGDVVVEGDDLMGDGVNIAARIESVAEAGGIALSRAVHEQVRGKLGVGFEDMGEIELKNLIRPVHVFAVVAAKPAPATAPLALPDKPSIAVLPFQNMSGDSEQEYFADGIVEDIITALSRISWFFVIARNSSFTYKGKAVDVRQVGRELGVRYVVEGSVRRAGNRLRITGQLVEAHSGNHVWADRYDGALEDVFDLQDSITSSIVSAIEPKLRQAEISRAQAKPTTDLSAYDLFLRAIALKSQYREATSREALALLERAIALDPGYSSAHGHIANSYMHFKTFGWGPVEEAEQRGMAAAQRAVETGPDDPTALWWGGVSMSYLGSEHIAGLAHVKRALMLNPNSAGAWRGIAWIHCFMGDAEEAIRHFETARRFSPVDPAAFDGYAGIAFAYLFQEQYETALAWAEKAFHERPPWVAGYWPAIVAATAVGKPRDYVDRIVQALRQVDSAPTVQSILRRFPFSPTMRKTFADFLRRAGLPE